MEAEAIEQQRKLFDMRLTGTLPSADDNGGNGLAKGSLPTTLEQLREILTKGAYPSRSRVSNKKDGRSKPKSLKRRTQSPSKKITHGDTCGPSLSIEWEQHRRPGGTTGITSGDPPRSKPEKDEGWQNGERGLQQQPDATPRVDGPINGTYPAEATNHGVQKELEVHHKDDGIEVVQQEVDYEMGEVGEEDQGEKVDDKDASMSPAGKSKHPADGDDPRGRSSTRRILRRGAPGRSHSTNTDGMSRSGEKQPDPEDASGSRGRAERGEASEETHTARDRTESKSPKRRGQEDKRIQIQRPEE
ncbi:hypothetical protein PF008_g20297 [Phytophthora fragariae]|uniref:Uncharacterized protein n=1 Tax=Phytophthora fragariae TaxID=53985 RepID=A0A6G0R064_9STRA|nr:hypothetical protein PF008_g20297 [Phytophthora fragariae]